MDRPPVDGVTTPWGAGFATDDGDPEAVRPPGVGQNGSIDESRLLAAHEDQLANTSYRITLVVREFVDGTETAQLTQTVLVENATTYRVSTSRFGTFGTLVPSFEHGTESTRLGGTRRTDAGTDPFLGDLVRYLNWYLSVERSYVVDVRQGDPAVVHIVTAGDPYPGVENSTGSAVVTEDGLVRSVRREYDVPNAEGHVVVSIRVSDVGRTTVPDSQ